MIRSKSIYPMYSWRQVWGAKKWPECIKANFIYTYITQWLLITMQVIHEWFFVQFWTILFCNLIGMPFQSPCLFSCSFLMAVKVIAFFLSVFRESLWKASLEIIIWCPSCQWMRKKGKVLQLKNLPPSSVLYAASLIHAICHHNWSICSLFKFREREGMVDTTTM